MKANGAFTFQASYARHVLSAGPIALYLELPVRDFWSGSALGTSSGSSPAVVTLIPITTVVSPTHQHHLFAGGGAVLKF